MRDEIKKQKEIKKMRVNLIADQNDVLYAAGKTKKDALAEFNWNMPGIKLTEEMFDIYGNIINEDGSPQAKSESEWRLIEADVNVDKIGDIVNDTEYEEI